MINQMKRVIKALRVGDQSKIEIHRSYSSYERAQKETFKSHESDNLHWAQGQVRFIDRWMADLRRESALVDVGCGDGVGLWHLRELGFSNVTGVDFVPEKLARAAQSGCRTVLQDFHSLSAFSDSEMDVVYSSHALEHALQPSRVVTEFYRILRPSGILILVLPYPDTGKGNEKAHCAKFELGTNIEDGGQTVVRYLQNHGFDLLKMEFDNFREPEIWLKFRKVTFGDGDIT